MKKIITIVLLSLLLAILSSCGLIILNTGEQPFVPEPPPVTETETETEPPEIIIVDIDNETTRKVRPVDTADNKARADKYLNALTVRDFGGVAIYIATSDAAMFTPDEAATIVDAARIERNQMVEEMYNTKIITIEADINTIFTQTLNAYNSDDYYTDIIAIPPESLGLFYSRNLLLNLNMLPFTDYSVQYYYDRDAMKQMSAGYGVYGIVGEFNKNIDYYYALYFNKTLAEELGVENPYDLVYDNKWTMDKFREMTLATVSYDGIFGHGSVLTVDNYIDFIYLSSGETLMDTGYNQTPALRYANDRGVAIVAMMRNLLYNDRTLYTGSVALGAFYRGDILFYVDTVSKMEWFYDMSDTWGIVPFPKLDQRHKYNTYVSQAFSVLAVPSNNSNVENIGAFLQAANAASFGYITDRYYAILQRNIVRDSDTLNMLDYITGYNSRGKLAFDFAYMFGPQYAYIGDRTYRALRRAVTENYSLQSLYNAYNKSIIEYTSRIFPMNLG
ncbi:MAG: hypothetical protein FWF15_02880 [Oscillospiraceae bacterium]|nr:hypothetical protein [Oscillospiraceae bacterium]